MIYLHEFRKLPVNKQYYILDKCGIELSALFNRQECKLLFSLDNFYVEIVYLRASSEIKSLFSFSDVDRLEPYLEVMLFRAIQELLGNAARHSQATLVKIILDLGEDRVRVSVDDNGKGFDESTLKETGLGLQNIRARASVIHGEITFESSPGKGTTVILAVPK